MTPLTRFRAGRGVALITESTLFLLDASNGSLAEEAWALMQKGAGSEELLEAISATGLRALGSFALAQIESDAADPAAADEPDAVARPRVVRVVARGSATIEVGAPAASRTLSGGGVRTWLEDVVPLEGAIELRLEGDSAADMPFRVTSGIVPATAVCRVLDDTAPSLVDADVPDASELDVWWKAPVELVRDQSVPTAEHARPTSVTAALDPGRTVTAADLESGDAPGLPAEAADDYDAIYGRTIMRSVHNAAVLPPDPAEAAAQGEPRHTAVAMGAMIDGIPGAGAATGGLAGDHDGRTISKAQLAALRAPAQSAPAAPTSGPLVQAVECPSGHANPPQAVLCRRCGQGIRTGANVVVARPVLGRVRFSTGDEVDLDRPVLIGRNPRIEGQIANELPHVVRLDIGQGLSRTHAAIRLEGWQVYLEDLNSANGTVVTLPGRAPRRLHAGEPALLEHGSLVDLGGEVTCTYEEIA